MKNYTIEFHSGTPKQSEVILSLEVKSKADMHACLYRNAVEEMVKGHLPFDFTVCKAVNDKP